MKKIKIQKIILVLIPVLFIFSGVSKADTFSFTYNDPSVCVPAWNNNCPSPNVTLLTTISINPTYNSSNSSINGSMPTSYQVCSSTSGGGGWTCWDANSQNAYNGNSRLAFTNTDVSKFTLVGQTDGQTYYFGGCPVGCQNPYIYVQSGDGVYWNNGSMTASSSTPLPNLSQNYTLSLTATPVMFPSAGSGNYSPSFVLQPFTISSNLFIPAASTSTSTPCTNTAPAPTTTQAYFCGSTAYFQTQSGGTQYTIGSTYDGKTIAYYNCNPDFSSPSTVNVYFPSQNVCDPKIFSK